MPARIRQFKRLVVDAALLPTLVLAALARAREDQEAARAVR